MIATLDSLWRPAGSAGTMGRNASTLAACAYGQLSVAVRTLQLRFNAKDKFCLRFPGWLKACCSARYAMVLAGMSNELLRPTAAR